MSKVSLDQVASGTAWLLAVTVRDVAAADRLTFG